MLDTYITFIKHDILASTTVIVTLLPLFLIIYRKAYVDPAFRLLFLFLFLKLFTDLLMFHYAANSLNNLMLFNVSIIYRYALLSGMFYFKFENKAFRNSVIPVAVAFILLTIWDIIASNPNMGNLREHRIVKYATTLEALLMIFWILAFFFELIRSLKIPSLLTYPFFWVCTGLLLYYSSLIFISPALHYAIRWESLFNIGFLDRILYGFEIIMIMLVSLGIWVFSARYYARR